MFFCGVWCTNLPTKVNGNWLEVTLSERLIKWQYFHLQSYKVWSILLHGACGSARTNKVRHQGDKSLEEFITDSYFLCVPNSFSRFIISRPYRNQKHSSDYF